MPQEINKIIHGFLTACKFYNYLLIMIFYVEKIIQDLFTLRFILYMEENQNNENFTLPLKNNNLITREFKLEPLNLEKIKK